MIRRHRSLAVVGSTHFITCVTNERGRWFTTPALARAMLSALELARAAVALPCLGFVLMPDHLRALVIQSSMGNAAGVYLYHVEYAGRVETHKLLLLK